MRTVTVELGNKEFTLTADFATSLEIAEKVGDPLTIAREGVLERMMLESGVTYEPKWRFTILNVVEIIYIGAKAHDSEITRKMIQNAVFEAGFFSARDSAVEYLASIIGPQPELPDEMKEKNTDKASLTPEK